LFSAHFWYLFTNRAAPTSNPSFSLAISSLDKLAGMLGLKLLHCNLIASFASRVRLMLMKNKSYMTAT